MALAARIVRNPRTIKQAEKAPASVSEEDAKLKLMGDVATKHPELTELLADYKLARDARAGTTAVQKAGEDYLPKPSGFRAQDDDGLAMYTAYQKRAQFPEIMAPTILGMSGIIHRREAQIEGLEEGTPLADLWEKASPDGLTLEGFHRRITEELLTLGRAAILADVATTGSDLPYLALYKAESLINWSEDRDFFVLEEEYRTREGFTWTDKKRYRVLELMDGQYIVRLLDDGGHSLLGIPEGEDTAPELLEPVARGNKKIEEIPLVVVGSRDLTLEPDEIPLIGVARSAFAIYRLDADYRHQLFMSGQETLFCIGLAKEDVPDYVGAGVVVSIPEGGDAKYVGPTGKGIDAHKVAIDDEREVAAAAGARVFDTGKRGAESGDALRIRARASTASLVSVALASAAALEQALRHAAVFVGYDPEKIIVTPNLDFMDVTLTPDEAVKLVELWQNKAISYETLYENLQRGEIASQDRTAEEEQELVAEEDAAVVEEMAALGLTTPDTGEDETGEVSEDELNKLFSPETLAGE